MHCAASVARRSSSRGREASNCRALRIEYDPDSAARRIDFEIEAVPVGVVPRLLRLPNGNERQRIDRVRTLLFQVFVC